MGIQSNQFHHTSIKGLVKVPVIGLEVQELALRFARPSLYPYARFDIDGIDHIPGVGPAILCGNHRSYFDVAAMSLTIAKSGRPARFLGKKEVFDAPVVGPIAAAMGGIRVDRGTGSDEPLAAAAAAPERFEALVLAGGTPRFVREPGWECGMQPELLNNFAHELFDSRQRTMMRFLGLQVRGADNERETLKTLRSAVERRPVPASQALRTGLDILLHADLRVQLAEMEMPMLSLYGERDTLVSAATAAEIDRMSTVAETSVIAGAGHAPFLSHPQQCLNAMGGYA